MTSIVYPLGNGSRLNDAELRYSLRSVEKNLSGYGKVFIVGRKPTWIHNITYIEAKDQFEVPDRNIMTKIMKACESPEVSETFLYMNDDHFLMHEFEIDKFPFFYSETIEAYLQRRGMDGYGQRVRNTYDYLSKNDLPTKYFDSHTPILIEKKRFKEIMNKVDWNKKYGFVIKSLYANSLKIEGQLEKDHKSESTPRKNDPVYSTTPKPKAAVTRFLSEVFNKKSRYEM